jgi:tetratricopeptide (TPR) repeat protein
MNPSSSLGYVANAQALLMKGDLHQGEAMLKSALEKDPVSLPALAMLVKLYGQEERTKEVVQRILGLTLVHPDNAGLRLLLAVSYFDLKDLEKSEASLQRAIAIDPNTPEAYTMLANIDYAKGSVEKAKIDLRTAIEMNPHNVANYLTLESSYKKEGNWEQAKKLCERAHQIDSASPEVAMELAFLYLEHGGDVNIAFSLAQMARRKLPDSPPAADMLGWAYYKLGSATSAIPQLEESVRKVPQHPVYQYHLGMAYMAVGQPQSAERSLRRALQNDPNLAYASIARATLDQISKLSR